jgi:hypothetical protein
MTPEGFEPTISAGERPKTYALLGPAYPRQSQGKSKGKGKVHPVTGHEGPEREWKYSCTLPLTSTLHGIGWSTPRPGRFTPPGKTLYLLYRRLGGPQSWDGRVRKISPPTGIRFPDRPARSEQSQGKHSMPIKV